MKEIKIKLTDKEYEQYINGFTPAAMMVTRTFPKDGLFGEDVF